MEIIWQHQASYVITRPGPDGTVIAEGYGPAGERVQEGLLGLWRFDEGSGDTVFDTVGTLDLAVLNLPNVTWLEDGLRLDAPTALLGANAGQVSEPCMTANALTVEAWIVPGESGWVLSLGNNVVLSQGVDHCAMGLLTEPLTPTWISVPLDVQPVPTHIIYTREPNGWESLWIDGVLGLSREGVGDLSTWDTATSLVLGNREQLDKPWLGTLHLAAFYDRALSAQEIAQNYAAGYAVPVVPQKVLVEVDYEVIDGEVQWGEARVV